MRRTIKQQIVIHVSYRQIFNAPVRISDCRDWLGIESKDECEFEMAIEELKQENLVVVKDGFLSVYGNSEIIDLQSEKERFSDALLAKGEKTLRILSKLLFIRYIGISGSVAARNPALQYSSKGKQYVDLDLFIITKSNCLWPLFLIERVLMNLKKLFKGYHFYCFNYVTDESFLEVYNKNFYTATEIINLHTFYDDGIYDDFIHQNSWHEKYYPESTKSIKSYSRKVEKKHSIWSLLMAPVNFISFALFCIARAIKRLEIAPIFEMFSEFNPIQKCNLKRISNPNGGYQEAIKQRFVDVWKENFRGYYSDEIMNDLFPPSSAFIFTPQHNVYDKESDKLFSKYKLSANEKNTI